jgi:hypothetical protein
MYILELPKSIWVLGFWVGFQRFVFVFVLWDFWFGFDPKKYKLNAFFVQIWI